MPRSAPQRTRVVDDAVVASNLAEMDGPMMRLLETESIGGNAGRVKLGGTYYACAAANGYSDPQSGQIVQFGNSQNVSQDILDTCAAFTVRVAYRPTMFFKIVHLVTDDRAGSRALTPVARRALAESVRRWNASRE